MADLRDQYGNPIRHTDEFGNPIHRDEFENRDHHGGTGPGLTNTGVGAHGQPKLRRSGSSSSSSSSEDDGMGGRRKKGVKEKVKEKLPGQHKQEPPHAGYGTGHAGYGTTHTPPPEYGTAHPPPPHAGTGHPPPPEYGTAVPAGYEQPQEKKSMMEKIKEKLPGHH